MDGREWDDEAETPVVCVGVSFFFGGGGEGIEMGFGLRRREGQPGGCLRL